MKITDEKTTLRTSLKQMRDNFFVYNSENLELEWNQSIGIEPRLFYDTLTKDLPGNISLSLEFIGGGQGEFIFKSDFLFAEQYFSKTHKELKIKEARIEENCRRNGIGKKLLRNYINLSKLWGIETIAFRAGREDGEFFWSKRGAVLENFPKMKEQFIKQVMINTNELGNKVSTQSINEINQILAKNDVQMNFNIASMKEKIDEKPIGVFLLKETNPHMLFKLTDKRQMQNVIKNL